MGKIIPVVTQPQLTSVIRDYAGPLSFSQVWWDAKTNHGNMSFLQVRLECKVISFFYLQTIQLLTLAPVNRMVRIFHKAFLCTALLKTYPSISSCPDH